MKIKSLKIDGYRNLKKDTITFSSGINFIYGKNAQGKTNLTEAVWMFTGARSFRGTKDADLVNFEKESAKLEGSFYFEKREQEISVFFSGGKRKVFLNGVPKSYPTNIIGKFRVVLFSPIHLSLISGGPEGRRKFLDAAICQLKPTYISLLVRYNQTLRHRNALLKKISMDGDAEFLEIWDEKLSELGSLIIKERLEYLDLLKKEASDIYNEISNRSESFDIKYISGFYKNIGSDVKTEDLKKEFKLKLEKNRKTDVKSGFTSVGPHKDEIEIFINEKKVRAFGSQGQQRSSALCLKLAEAEILEEKIGEPPVLLLDDVMSELDDFRKNYMLNKITNKQVFITNCDFSIVSNLKNGKLFKMEDGKITEIKEF